MRMVHTIVKTIVHTIVYSVVSILWTVEITCSHSDAAPPYRIRNRTKWRPWYPVFRQIAGCAKNDYRKSQKRSHKK